MKIYLATWMEDNQGKTLTKVGYHNRLMSYYFLRNAKSNFLPLYTKFGKVKTKKETNKNENK